MKLACVSAYYGTRVVAPDILDGLLVDGRAGCAWQLELCGHRRGEAVRQAQRKLSNSIPSRLEDDLGESRQDRRDRLRGEVEGFGVVENVVAPEAVPR